MLIVNPIHRAGVALLRVAVGVIFLWAGLQKLLGAGPDGFSAVGFLRFATSGSIGWPFIAGEPAEDAVYNPTQGFWLGLAENEALMTLVNVLVVYGQIAIGIALIAGLLTRFAAIMGALQMVFFFFAAWEFDHGIVNQHLTYAVVCLAIAGLGAGNYFGLDRTFGPRAPRWVRDYLMSGDPDELRRRLVGGSTV
jgi:thiosulfate dehydrogenase [quinone] large subunit